MARNLIKTFYYSAPPNGIARRTVVQTYLIVLALFNTALHLLPFGVWKRFLCHLCGIKLGNNASLSSGVRFLALGHCRIGDRTIINRDCLLDNRAGLSIGSDVSIATGVRIFTQGHDIESENFALTHGEVSIADHVCVFANALIMPGTQLGRGCVVYAGAVVTKSVGEMEVVGGNPASFIKRRKRIPDYRLNSDFWFN